MRRVLDDGETTRPRELEDRFHVTGLAADVDGDDGFRPTRQPRLDGAHIDVQRIGADVGQDGTPRR